MRSDVVFALYVTGCYWAVIVVGAFVSDTCYARLNERGGYLEKEIAADVRANSHAPSRVQILRCAQSRYSSKSMNKILLASPGLLLFFWIILLRRVLSDGKTRGASILFSFAVACILVNMLTRYTSGLGFSPSTSVLMAAFFYGAVFWWIDSIAEKGKFDSLLASVVASPEKTEKLKLLYEHTKNCLTLMSTLFLAVCIAMVFNISVIIKEQYTAGGLAAILTGWAIWLTFWGSLGLLGWVGSELGRQVSLILKALR
jgi:hypothetical protein